MSKVNIPHNESVFNCPLCRKSKKLKEMSHTMIAGKPMCKRCEKLKNDTKGKRIAEFITGAEHTPAFGLRR